jgi:hypothetical protein
MKVLRLVALGNLVLSVAASVWVAPVWAQTESFQSPEAAPEQAPVDIAEELPADLLAPLKVDQQQADEFFAPPSPQPIQNQAAPAVSSEERIGPPPGSQTPAELTPGQQLTIPIR